MEDTRKPWVQNTIGTQSVILRGLRFWNTISRKIGKLITKDRNENIPTYNSSGLLFRGVVVLALQLSS